LPSHQLLLCPAEPDSPPVDTARLAACLRALRLVGEPVTVAGNTVYPTGERFLQLITFLGCAPAIELHLPEEEYARREACASGAVCHIRITGHDDLHFRGDLRAIPRCPACRQPAVNWRECIASWRSDPENTHWQCVQCGHTGRLHELNFRKSGGFARTFIEIHGIHPSEAIPVASLLDALRDFTGGPWKTLYVTD